MKVVGYVLAWLIVLFTTSSGVSHFELNEAAGEKSYLVFFGFMAIGAAVVACTSWFRGRRPWLWLLLSLPSPALSMLVLVLKKDLNS